MKRKPCICGDDNCSLNDGHIHEAMDRVYCLVGHIDSDLRGHPLINQFEELLGFVERAEDALAELYQKIGQYDTIQQMENK